MSLPRLRAAARTDSSARSPSSPESSSTICFRVTKEERFLLDAVAHEQGDTLSELVRSATFDVARDVLDRVGRDQVVERYEAHRKQQARRSTSRL